MRTLSSKCFAALLDPFLTLELLLFYWKWYKKLNMKSTQTSVGPPTRPCPEGKDNVCIVTLRNAAVPWPTRHPLKFPEDQASRCPQSPFQSLNANHRVHFCCDLGVEDKLNSYHLPCRSVTSRAVREPRCVSLFRLFKRPAVQTQRDLQPASRM